MFTPARHRAAFALEAERTLEAMPGVPIAPRYELHTPRELASIDARAALRAAELAHKATRRGLPAPGQGAK
jgi:hypothetical protein